MRTLIIVGGGIIVVGGKIIKFNNSRGWNKSRGREKILVQSGDNSSRWKEYYQHNRGLVGLN